jgi:RNA polymerase sigma-70 factor (ECF subfamily)
MRGAATQPVLNETESRGRGEAAQAAVPPASDAAATVASLDLLHAVLRQHKDPIISYLARMTRDFQLAEELAQDVFVTFHRECQNIPPRAFATWLYRTAQRRAIDAARRRRRRPAPMWLEDLQLEPAAVGDSPEAARVSILLERAVSELPRRFREVFLLCEVERVPQEEVAQILACAKKTISTRLFRARARLLRSVARAMEREGLNAGHRDPRGSP